MRANSNNRLTTSDLDAAQAAFDVERVFIEKWLMNATVAV